MPIPCIYRCSCLWVRGSGWWFLLGQKETESHVRLLIEQNEYQVTDRQQVELGSNFNTNVNELNFYLGNTKLIQVNCIITILWLVFTLNVWWASPGVHITSGLKELPPLISYTILYKCFSLTKAFPLWKLKVLEPISLNKYFKL